MPTSVPMSLPWQPVAVTAIIACVFVVARWLLRDRLWQPWQVRKRLQAQGVKGPPFVPIVGNRSEFIQLQAKADISTPTKQSSYDIVHRVLPYYATWSKLYGDMFVYTFGSEVRLTIADPELVKEILNNKSGHFPKVPPNAYSRDLLGDTGLVLAKGEKWAKERRILNPGFHNDKLKAMVETIADLTTRMLNDWERRLVKAKQPKGVDVLEVDVLKEYCNLTADVIAHTAFGSNYEEGKTVFELQYSQQQMVREANLSIHIPGQSMLPTLKNLKRWKIRNTIEDKLRKIVEKRLIIESQKESQGEDLLGIMISAYKGELPGNQKNLRMSIQDIVNECKTFFFAGHETTASMLTWTTMLLALHPDWQERTRAEVIEVCGNTHPTSDMLNQLKLVSMVINEAMRLYPVAIVLIRCTDREMKLGKFVIPKGTVLHLMLMVLMHSKQLWGEDADDFNPERFSEGVANACKTPLAFMPFSTGPRNCIGQVFALMEAKVVLCKLLQRFRFQLSPSFVHAPTSFGVLKPKHGMQVLVKPIHICS